MSYPVALVTSMLFTAWLVGCDCKGQPASLACPNGFQVATMTSSPSLPGDPSVIDVPCGVSPCDDGLGGNLSDVGEQCAGDDNSMATNLDSNCCHGLTCSPSTAGPWNTCARASATAGQQTCPSVWLYQCTGWFQSKSGVSVNWLGSFTGPPPSVVSSTAQGGLDAWMKIAFAARYPTITQYGTIYYYLAAKNCMSVGPYLGP